MCLFIFIFFLDVIVFVLRKKNEVDGGVDDVDVLFGNMYPTYRQQEH